MSELFDIVYNSPALTPVVGRALTAYITEELGADVWAAGHIALDENYRIVGARVYIYATGVEPESAVFPHGNDDSARDDFFAWMKELGATTNFTFARRPNDDHQAHPHRTDAQMFDMQLAEQTVAGLNYAGHLITTGTYHGLLLEGDGPSAEAAATAMDILMRSLSSEEKAVIGRSILSKAREEVTDLEPDVESGMEAAIEALESGGNVTDEQRELVDRAFRAIERRLANQGLTPGRPRNPTDLPDTTKRPDVPGAFYEN